MAKGKPQADELIVSVAGVRGIAGTALNAEVVARYAGAFARSRKGRTILVGGDSRRSRAWIQPIVMASILAEGKSPVPVGLMPTPTFGILARKHRAAGAIAITASHNPAPYNGLKFFSAKGVFLDAAGYEEVSAAMERRAPSPMEYEASEPLDEWESLATHLECIAKVLPKRRGRLRVAIDACNGAGSKLSRMTAQAYGADPFMLNDDPTELFPHEAEPLPENLKQLRAAVKREKAAVGFAIDPDADRLALVDETGRAIGEERTLVLAADAYLSMAKKKGPLVANLSSSRALEDVAAKHSVSVFRSKVGEAHVTALMAARKAPIGGEGNGGVILPAVHPGRDAATAIALILLGLHRFGGSLSEWNATIPDYALVKDKAPRAGLDTATIYERLRAAFPSATFDETDGLKLVWSDRWIHVRPSGTEPIVRIFAEAPKRGEAQGLVEQVREAMR